jgi:EmrB/QacA subfamily drug resistance transporter
MQVPDVASRRYANRWVGLIFICVSLIVIALDNTILNVALPSISNTLGATATDLQWIVDSYVLVFAALLLTTGSFSDRIGRKKALQIGLVLFGIGSLAAALSTSTVMLIASRAFLGLAGALIMPATLSLVSASFPPMERGQAIGIWVAVFGFGVGLGPVIGGFLIQHFSWNAVFFVNLPVVAVALIGGAIYLVESKDESAPKADVPGVILSIIGLFALIYGIIEAGLHGWTGTNVIAAFAIAAVFLGAFAWWENRSPSPMLPMYFFLNRAFTGANIMLTMFSFSLFGSMFFMSQYFQTVQNVPAFEAGLRVLPHAITMTFMSTRANKIAARLGHKRTIGLGTLIAAAGMFYMSQIFHAETPYILIAIGQVILAVGLGTAFSPATTAVMNSVPSAKAGIGSAMNDTTRQLGGALGVAVLGTIATNTYLNGIAPLRESLTSLAPEAAQMVSNSIQAAHLVARQMPMSDSLRETIITTTNHAFVNGMNNAMLISSVTMLLAFFLVLLVLPSQVGSVEMHTGDVSEERQAIGVPVPSGD